MLQKLIVEGLRGVWGFEGGSLESLGSLKSCGYGEGKDKEFQTSGVLGANFLCFLYFPLAVGEICEFLEIRLAEISPDFRAELEFLDVAVQTEIFSLFPGILGLPSYSA